MELDYPAETLRYIKTDGDNIYYVQIINPSDEEVCDALCFAECDLTGGTLCL